MRHARPPTICRVRYDVMLQPERLHKRKQVLDKSGAARKDSRGPAFVLV